MRWYFNFLFPRIRAYSTLDLRSISTSFYIIICSIIIGWRYTFLNCDSIYRTNENCTHGWMGDEGMKDVSAKSRCRVDARRARAWAALVVSRASKAGRGTSGESPSSLRVSEGSARRRDYQLLPSTEERQRGSWKEGGRAADRAGYYVDSTRFGT